MSTEICLKPCVNSIFIIFLAHWNFKINGTTLHLVGIFKHSLSNSTRIIYIPYAHNVECSFIGLLLHKYNLAVHFSILRMFKLNKLPNDIIL